MATITAKLVTDPALGVQVPYNGKPGTYEAYIVKYVDDRGQVKDLIKPMSSLKYKKSMESTLRELKAGETVTIVTEKNDKGFLDVQSIQKGQQDLPADGANSGAGSAARSSGAPVAVGRSTSTYETPEERKVKQRLIVRQAALNQAIELANVAKDKTVNIDSILPAAEQFENWVYREIE
jgi:hypothetical protein